LITFIRLTFHAAVAVVLMAVVAIVCSLIGAVITGGNPPNLLVGTRRRIYAFLPTGQLTRAHEKTGCLQAQHGRYGFNLEAALK
jgi:hypothetical protein